MSMRIPKIAQLDSPLNELIPYVSDHNILQLHIRMHNAQLMQVIESIEQLPHHLQHFLLLEQREPLLETEERVLSVLHD